MKKEMGMKGLTIVDQTGECPNLLHMPVCMSPLDCSSQDD